MPRINILAELSSVIKTNPSLNTAIADFVLEMQNLKQFHKLTEHLGDTTFITYSKKVFSRWTIQELFLFLAIFGTDERLRFLFDGNGLSPEYILENIFCYPQLHNCE